MAVPVDQTVPMALETAAALKSGWLTLLDASQSLPTCYQQLADDAQFEGRDAGVWATRLLSTKVFADKQLQRPKPKETI